MQFKISALVFLGSVVASVSAQTTMVASGVGAGCAAQTVLVACLSQFNAQVQACGAQDWGCLCQGYKNVLECYNNCPNDVTRATPAAQEVQYCNVASQYPSSTTLISAAIATTASNGATSAASAVTTAISSVDSSISSEISSATHSIATKSSGLATVITGTATSTSSAPSTTESKTSGAMRLQTFGVSGLVLGFVAAYNLF